MKHILFTILVGIPIYCQNPQKAVIWKISNPQLDKPSYLFGKLTAYGILAEFEMQLRCLDSAASN